MLMRWKTTDVGKINNNVVLFVGFEKNVRGCHQTDYCANSQLVVGGACTTGTWYLVPLLVPCSSSEFGFHN